MDLGIIAGQARRRLHAIVTNLNSNNVSWFDLTNPLLPVVLATVAVGEIPLGVAIN